jgi:uncharacterized membrane protein YqjE
MRLLWSLPKAAPALLRHVIAYAELVGQDLEQLQRDFGARLLADVIVGICVFFLMLTGCLLVVAMTWDTPHRVSAIIWMGVAFLLVAVVAVAYRFQVVSSHAPFLATVRREWAEDRVILDRILSPEEEE